MNKIEIQRVEKTTFLNWFDYKAKLERSEKDYQNQINGSKSLGWSLSKIVV